MGYTISERNSISLTRGDSFIAKVDIFDPNGDPFFPPEGSNVRFAMKEDYEEPKTLLLIDIPIDTMLLEIKPEDTKSLPFGKYVYDVQYTSPSGKVDTFIAKGRFILTEEVC